MRASVPTPHAYDLFGPLPVPVPGVRDKNARVLRDQGMAATLRHERAMWRALFRLELDAYLGEMGARAFLPEDFFAWFRMRGNWEPHHPNVWGAMWNACARAGMVVKTGVHRPTCHAQGHARDGTEWMKGNL